MRRIIILGAGGSIGSSALRVCCSHPDHLKVVGIHVHTSVNKLLLMANNFPDARLVVSGYDSLSLEGLKLYAIGFSAIYRLIMETDADMVLNGISGSAGLLPSFWSLESGKNLALANKESLVIAGDLLFKTAKKYKRTIFPIDSEHWALYDMVRGVSFEEVTEFTLTASGGPFHGFSVEQLKSVTLEQALKHPTWNMGVKISIDSATLANKGLEVIEACRFFGISVDKVKVVVHRQSLIHAMVRLSDGSLRMHASVPTMELPIQNVLLYPLRKIVSNAILDFNSLRTLSLEPVPKSLSLMLNLAYSVCRRGGFAPLFYNAANEAAVRLFQQGCIRFDQIAKVVERVLDKDIEDRDYYSLKADDLYAVHQEVYSDVLYSWTVR